MAFPLGDLHCPLSCFGLFLGLFHVLFRPISHLIGLSKVAHFGPKRRGMNEKNKNRPRQYRSQIPKPDRNGDVRPRIGGRRFTVGNVRTNSLGEMERRMNSLKEFFDAQCVALEIDF